MNPGASPQGGHDAVPAFKLILARVCEPLVHEPGTQVEYSDLGFILLGEIIERLTGERSSEFAKGHIFAPLGMNDTMFNPPDPARRRIAPTELDVDFRKRLLRGEVHDENAFALGGVAGMPDFFDRRRRGGFRADVPEWRDLRASSFAGAGHHSSNLPRGRPWATPRGHWDGTCRRRRIPPAGIFFAWRLWAPGFTGTSLWIDPERRLCGAADQSRESHARQREIRQVRPAIHDAILQALGLANASATLDNSLVTSPARIHHKPHTGTRLSV